MMIVLVLMTSLVKNEIAWPTPFHRQEIISKLFGCRRKAPRQVHDDIVSHQGLFCWCWLFYIGVLTCLSDDFPIAQAMEQNSISNTPSLDLHVIMEHSPSVTNYYRLISMRKFHL